MEESVEDGPGTLSSSLTFSLASPAQCLGDVADTLVPEWSKSIGSSNTVDISRLLCTFLGLCTEVEATLFLVGGGKTDGPAQWVIPVVWNLWRK